MSASATAAQTDWLEFQRRRVDRASRRANVPILQSCRVRHVSRHTHAHRRTEASVSRRRHLDYASRRTDRAVPEPKRFGEPNTKPAEEHQDPVPGLARARRIRPHSQRNARSRDRTRGTDMCFLGSGSARPGRRHAMGSRRPGVQVGIGNGRQNSEMSTGLDAGPIPAMASSFHEQINRPLCSSRSEPTGAEAPGPEHMSTSRPANVEVSRTGPRARVGVELGGRRARGSPVPLQAKQPSDPHAREPHTSSTVKTTICRRTPAEEAPQASSRGLGIRKVTPRPEKKFS